MAFEAINPGKLLQNVKQATEALQDLAIELDTSAADIGSTRCNTP